MSERLKWDQAGERLYETGVKNGVLYVQNSGAYPTGVAWNGLSSVSESPEGAEATAIYADNMKYLNLYSAEDFKATVEAYMYPDEFAECDGSAELVAGSGVFIGQQKRKSFGLCYRTELGNDEDGEDYGYKIHIIYGCKASPTERAYETINDSPDAITFSWEITTTPVDVTGHKPTATIVIDSTKLDSAKLAAVENALYGIDAAEFDATQTYAVGVYVTHSNKTYRCKTAITTAAAWDNSKWDEVSNAGPYLPLPDEILTMIS